MISVIVPTKGRTESLKRCVEAIVRNTDVPFELVVVNSGSRDEVLPLLSKSAVLISGRFSSYAEAMNIGIRAASGSYFTIPGIANDIVVGDRWAKPLVKALDDPKVGMAIPGVMENSIGKVVYGGFINPDAYNFDPNKEPHYAGYGLVRKGVIMDVGLLDENFSPIYLEDADYGFRLRKAGYKLVPCSDSLIYHNHEQAERLPHDGRNRKYFEEKWGV